MTDRLAHRRADRPAQRLLGMPLDAVSLQEAVDLVVEGVCTGRGGAVLTSNVDVLRQHWRSPRIREAFESAELAVADGTPVVWALRVQRTPVPRRITGTDLLWSLTAAAATHGKSVFLAGGRPGAARRAADRFVTLHPGLRAESCACYVEPRTAVQRMDDLATALVEAAPDIAYLGLPFTYQVQAIDAVRPRLPSTWFVGVGSSFDFVNGDRARAPEWLQRAGLEWAFRLTQQPALWRRYLLYDLPFAAYLGLHVLGKGLRRRSRRPVSPWVARAEP